MLKSIKVMAKTLICIHFSRTLLAILIVIFIMVSILKLFGFPYMPSPDYSALVFVLLDLVLVVGLIAAATQHLKTLIVFGWLIGLTFLLIFFGNTVSSQYQSDLWGMLYMLSITIVAFTDAVCVIKYRMPKDQMIGFTCHQQQVLEVPPPPPVSQYYEPKSGPHFHAV